MGKPIEGAIERVLAGAPKNEEASTQGNGNYEIPTSEKRNYIQVPQFGIAIATRETHLGKDMFSTLETLAGEKLKMPSQRQFMRHWFNVEEAAKGKRKLLYADGTTVEDDVSKDLWNYMSSTDRSRFGGKPCWTWLNSLFKEENGKWFVEEDLKVLSDAKGKKYLKGTPTALDACIMKDGYVDLSFNPQNLPTSNSSAQKYEQGKNLYFWHPRKDSVAWFDAGSAGAGLGCGRGPTDSGPSLGVFASQKISGGKS